MTGQGSHALLLRSIPQTHGIHARLITESAFLVLVVMMFLVAFSPLKPAAYLLPVCFVGGAFITGAIKARSLLRIGTTLVTLCIVAFVHSLVNPEFLWGNFILGLITFSSFLVLLCDFSAITSRALLRKIVVITLVVTVAQSFWGIVQGVHAGVVGGGWSFDGAVGDAVKGTVNPAFGPDGTGSNQIFAILVSGVLIMLYLSRTLLLKLWERYLLVPVAVAWILASVMHTFFFFAGGLLVSALVARPVWIARARHSNHTMRTSVRVSLAILVLLACFFLILALVFPDNLGLLVHLLEQTFAGDPEHMTPKALATVNTLLYLPESHGYQPWIGVGLGQYSSRAGLIMSGTYLGRDFFLGPQYAEFSYELIYKLQERLRDHDPEAGSTKFPFYSWLTLYGEFGAAGIALVIIVITRNIRRFLNVVKEVPGSAVLLAPVVLGTFYLLFLGFQDNYWEFAQAIFPLLVLMKVFYDLGMHEWRQQKSSLTKPI